MPNHKVVYIRLAVLCALTLSGRFVNAQEKSAPNAVQVHVVITDAGAQSDSEVPRLKQEEVKVKQGKTFLQVTQLIPAQEDNAALQLMILIDDVLNTSAVGNNLNDIKEFIKAQPPSTVVAVGYMSNAGVNVAQNFTADHEQAIKAIRLPRGTFSSMDSPYLSLIKIVKGWPQQSVRRVVLMVSDGVDRLRGETPRADQLGPRWGTVPVYHSTPQISVDATSASEISQRYTVVSAAAQQSGAGVPPAQPADMHSSRNSLDWAGTYEGVLPCADCPGTKTRLTLNYDGSYRLVTQAQGSQNAEKSVSGVFTWQPNGNAITLDERGGGQQFSVGEGRLTLLRPKGGASQSPAGNLVLTLAAPQSEDLEQQLGRYRWTLAFATDADNRRIAGLPPGEDRPVVLSFAGSRLSVQGPCNRLVGGYKVTAANQLIVNVGASTRMACDPVLMNADSALSNLLAKPLHVQMTGRPSAQLQLVSPGNGTLSFTGEPTPESLYGAGTTVFLEIAAQSVACPNPPWPNTRCLQYRERHYDDKGLVVGTPGEWKPLTVNIEGFTHREGVRNVLRVKQFQGPASADGAPSKLYVLDLVVESEIVKP